MKTSSETKPSRRAADWILPAFCVFCAAGAGITGTMLLLENRQEKSAPSTSQNAPSAPTNNPLLNPMLNASNAPSQPALKDAAPFADALPQTAPNPGAPMENALSADATTQDNAPNAHPHGPPPSTAGMRPAEAALLMANWHYDVAHWNEAIAKYQETIAAGLDNADVRTDLGNCYRFSAQPQKALEQYRIAQKGNPQHENSFFNQGGLFAAELKQPARGVAIWKEYLRRFPKGQNVSAAKKLVARYDK